jgi:hypothetical protein
MVRAQKVEIVKARFPVELRNAATVIGMDRISVARVAHRLIHRIFAAAAILSVMDALS